MQETLITGAAGNLGSLLARHLIAHAHPLRLMYHRKPLSADVASARGVSCVQADLGDSRTLPAALDGVGRVVHLAGVLFAPRPERFLPITNIQSFSNLLDASLEARVERVVLISFPHVEGITSVEAPATGRLDRRPISVHAQTRLEEERLLLERTRGTAITPIVLRLGMGTASSAVTISASDRGGDSLAGRARGIYHVGDEQPVTLQHFLDEACDAWGYARPFRVPMWLVYLTASLCELFAAVARTRSPVTRDFIRIGRVSHWGDTRRAREELIPDLVYPTLASGRATL